MGKSRRFEVFVLAEREGFEPSEPCGSLDFESSTIDHSATSPGAANTALFYQPESNSENQGRCAGAGLPRAGGLPMPMPMPVPVPMRWGVAVMTALPPPQN